MEVFLALKSPMKPKCNLPPPTRFHPQWGIYSTRFSWSLDPIPSVVMKKDADSNPKTLAKEIEEIRGRFDLALFGVIRPVAGAVPKVWTCAVDFHCIIDKISKLVGQQPSNIKIELYYLDKMLTFSGFSKGMEQGHGILTQPIEERQEITVGRLLELLSDKVVGPETFTVSICIEFS